MACNIDLGNMHWEDFAENVDHYDVFCGFH